MAERPSIEEIFSEFARSWMALAANSADIAHSRMTLYRAYLSEGFTEAQALELIKQA